MLRNLKDLHGYSLRATDGDIGTITDFYSWLASRKVLISPVSIGVPNHGDKVLPVVISRAQVKDSPNIDTDKPVSRQHEVDYLDY